MRIKGVSFKAAPVSVQRLYHASTERLGHVPVPLTAFAHRPEIAEAHAGLSGALTGSKAVEPRLKTLACMRAAQIAGCPF